MTSANPRLIPNPTVVGQFGVDARIEFTPAPDANGTTELTVVARDDGGTEGGGQDTSSRRLTIVVRPVNDPPRANDDAYSAIEDVPFTSAIGLLVNDIEVDNEALTAVIERDVNAGTLNLRTDGVFTFIAPPDQSGTFDFAYRATDAAGLSTVGEVTIVVAAVNDPPAADPMASTPILEDAGPQIVTITGIHPGPSDESGQTVTVDARTSAGELFADVNVTTRGTNADVSFRPIPNAFGTGDIIVALSDDGVGNNTQQVSVPINIIAVNDPPTFELTAPITLEPGPQTVIISNLRPGPGEADQGLDIDVSVEPAHRRQDFVLTPISDGRAELTLIPNEPGPVTVTVEVNDDGGTANGGIDTTEQTIDIVFVAPTESGGCRTAAAPSTQIWLFGVVVALLLIRRSRSSKNSRVS